MFSVYLGFICRDSTIYKSTFIYFSIHTVLGLFNSILGIIIINGCIMIIVICNLFAQISPFIPFIRLYFIGNSKAKNTAIIILLSLLAIIFGYYILNSVPNPWWFYTNGSGSSSGFGSGSGPNLPGGRDPNIYTHSIYAAEQYDEMSSRDPIVGSFAYARGATPTSNYISVVNPHMYSPFEIYLKLLPFIRGDLINTQIRVENIHEIDVCTPDVTDPAMIRTVVLDLWRVRNVPLVYDGAHAVQIPNIVGEWDGFAFPHVPIDTGGSIIIKAARPAFHG